MLRDLDTDSDPQSPSEACALDREDLEIEPLAVDSLDFFLLLFLGASAFDSPSASWPEFFCGPEFFCRVDLTSPDSLFAFLEDRLDCLGLSDFSLGGESPTPPIDECRLDDFGSSGKSLDEDSEATMEFFLLAESTTQHLLIRIKFTMMIQEFFKFHSFFKYHTIRNPFYVVWISIRT